MKRKPFRPSATLPQNVLPYQARVGLANAEALIQRKQWAEAHELLEDLNRQYPGRNEILTELLNLAYDLGDMHCYLDACLPLTRLRPNDPSIAMNLAGAYLQNGFVFLARRAFRQFLERWPNHERARDMRETLQRCEETLPKLLDEMGLDGEQRWEIACLHEEVQVQIQLGHYAEARRVSQTVLELKPDFTAALNNLSLSYSAEGLLEESLAVAERVLAIDPENVHALSNMTRFLCIIGQKERAHAFGDRLKQSPAKGHEKYLKIAEALHFLGDDAGIVAAYQQANKVGKDDSSWDEPVFLHMVAVAMQRLGKAKVAQQLWEVVLEKDPNYQLTLANLEDLQKPVEERQGAWPFAMANWVLKPMKLDALRRSLDKHDDPDIAFQTIAKQSPEFLKVIPSLLERGDPVGRQFALYTAQAAGTPEMLEALHVFALGQWGPDQLRLIAAKRVMEAGLVNAETMRMWLQGEWREVFTLNYEIYSEPKHQHSEQVTAWVEEAIELIHTEDVARAEVLLQQALDVEPDAPDLLYNMALVYSKQGRDQEAEDLIQRTHQRYPDYLFARVNIAHKLLGEEKVEEARALIEPLLKRKRLHISEFSTLAIIQVEVLIAENHVDAAETWIGMWEQTYPEDRLLEEARHRLGIARIKAGLAGLLNRRRRKKER